MTSDFEKWWVTDGRNGIFSIYHSLDDDAVSAVKKLAWEAWKVGRERLHNEITVPQPQLVRR
jgi:hypothetical protein